ncbi:hypothetical protein WA158_003055 [Blastocystis sp. Blastoise]
MFIYIIQTLFNKTIPIFQFLENYKFWGGISLVTFISSLLTCSYVKKNIKIPKMSWLEMLLLCFVHQYGGSMLSSLVLGNPIHVLKHDILILTFIFAWFLCFIFPFDIMYRFLVVKIIRKSLRVLEFVYMSKYMCDHAMDIVIDSSNHDSGYFMILTVGTLAGCGGSLLVEQFQLLRDKNHIDLSYRGLSHPSFVMRRSFFGSFLYMCLRNPFNLSILQNNLSHEECKYILFLFFTFTYILYIYHFDVFNIISWVFHKVTFIPTDITTWVFRWSTLPQEQAEDSGYISEEMENKKED